MTKQAERPVTIPFTSNYRQSDPEFTCTFDSNRFIEWEIVELDMPIGQVIFKGDPIEDNGYTELARVKFDYCDNGLSIHQDLANMLYEAQHPWLDYVDAVEKEILSHKDIKCLCLYQSLYSGENYDIMPFTKMKDDRFIKAFKPIESFDFYHFNQVKVWQPPQ
jgi:hypothetical protein